MVSLRQCAQPREPVADFLPHLLSVIKQTQHVGIVNQFHNVQLLHLISILNAPVMCLLLSCVCVHQVQKEVHMQWLRWQERSYGVVSPAAKGSQMDTPF